MKVKAWIIHGGSFLAFYSVVFYKFNPNALSELNQIWVDSRRSTDGAMVKILVLCVSWFARKLVYRQTDGRTDTAIA